MARYQADVWLGSASGRQRVYVNSNTWNGAREQIKTIYQVQDTDIWNLGISKEPRAQVDADAETALLLGGICFLILAWKYVLAIALVVGVIWLIYKYFINKHI